MNIERVLCTLHHKALSLRVVSPNVTSTLVGWILVIWPSRAARPARLAEHSATCPLSEAELPPEADDPGSDDISAAMAAISAKQPILGKTDATIVPVVLIHRSAGYLNAAARVQIMTLLEKASAGAQGGRVF